MTLGLRKLVDAAILAPTPDNNQPWRFTASDDRLRIFLNPSRTLPSDVNGMFDLVGLGAAAENASLAALQMGYRPQLQIADLPFSAFLNDPSQPVATMEFAPGGVPDPLFDYLEARCTNRRLYSRKPLPEVILAALTTAAQYEDAVRVDWVTNRIQVAAIARLVAATDLIRFEYEPFHNELFRQLRFTVEEVQRTRDGLDVRTLDLPPGAAWLLRKLQPWKRMRKIHQLGLGRLLTLPSALAVKRSGAIGLISVAQPTLNAFLRGGMAFERLWLAATARRLALQPLGSPSIFLAHLHQLGGSRLTAEHSNRMQELADQFHQILPQMSGRVVQIMFRIGHSGPPSARSLRQPIAAVSSV